VEDANAAGLIAHGRKDGVAVVSLSAKGAALLAERRCARRPDPG
jgi:hypothetical protein